jgi:hypothetical protein
VGEDQSQFRVALEHGAVDGVRDGAGGVERKFHDRTGAAEAEFVDARAVDRVHEHRDAPPIEVGEDRLVEQLAEVVT